MIRYICATCQVELRPPEQLDDPEQQVSHGLCRSCVTKAMKQLGLSLRMYLDELDKPVLVVNQDSRVLAVNDCAQQMLGKDLDEIEGYLGGEVFGCFHAKEPGGCGATLHCLSCVIRNTVEDTYHTGNEHQMVPACQDLDTVSGPRETRFIVSTKKVGELVVLKIEDMLPQ